MFLYFLYDLICSTYKSFLCEGNQILWKVNLLKWTTDSLSTYPRRNGTSEHRLTLFWEHKNECELY